jgi:hypothetical protein
MVWSLFSPIRERIFSPFLILAVLLALVVTVLLVVFQMLRLLACGLVVLCFLVLVG